MNQGRRENTYIQSIIGLGEIHRHESTGLKSTHICILTDIPDLLSTEVVLAPASTGNEWNCFSIPLQQCYQFLFCICQPDRWKNHVPVQVFMSIFHFVLWVRSGISVLLESWSFVSIRSFSFIIYDGPLDFLFNLNFIFQLQLTFNIILY